MQSKKNFFVFIGLTFICIILLTAIFVRPTSSLMLILAAVLCLTPIAMLFMMSVYVNKTSDAVSTIQQFISDKNNGKNTRLNPDDYPDFAEIIKNIQKETLNSQKTDNGIEEIHKLLSNIANGNFDFKLPALSDEYKTVSEDLDDISTNFSSSFADLQKYAAELFTGAESMASDASSVNARMNNITELIKALVDNSDNISTQIKNTATGAKDAREEGESTTSEIQNCNAEMHRAIEAMNEISIASNEIGKIIQAIEDIAFQTNILALNAAVEAARAGEAGRGFAVVADEVRNLANKSAEAANDTNTLIKRTLSAVNNGTSIVNNTASSLEDIVEHASNLLVHIETITASAEQQTLSIAQINEGISQMHEAAQFEAENSQSNADMTSELYLTAQEMKEIVSKYKISSDRLESAASQTENSDASNDISPETVPAENLNYADKSKAASSSKAMSSAVNIEKPATVHITKATAGIDKMPSKGTSKAAADIDKTANKNTSKATASSSSISNKENTEKIKAVSDSKAPAVANSSLDSAARASSAKSSVESVKSVKDSSSKDNPVKTSSQRKTEASDTNAGIGLYARREDIFDDEHIPDDMDPKY